MRHTAPASHIVPTALAILVMLTCLVGCETINDTMYDEPANPYSDQVINRPEAVRQSEQQSESNATNSADRRVDYERPDVSRQLDVQAESFRHGRPIPTQYSAYGENISPALSWSVAPNGTQSFVIIMEDPDVEDARPFTHWLLYNIPPGITNIRTALPQHMRLELLGGALQGRNSYGSIGYFGPRPPAGDPPHRYYFRVYALDRMLDIGPGADRNAVQDAMRGHVLAEGVVMGTYQHQYRTSQ